MTTLTFGISVPPRKIGKIIYMLPGVGMPQGKFGFSFLKFYKKMAISKKPLGKLGKAKSNKRAL